MLDDVLEQDFVAEVAHVDLALGRFEIVGLEPLRAAISFDRFERDLRHVAARGEGAVFVENISEDAVSTCQPRSCALGHAEDDDRAVYRIRNCDRLVAFDDDGGPRVTHGSAFAGHPGEEAHRLDETIKDGGVEVLPMMLLVVSPLNSGAGRTMMRHPTSLLCRRNRYPLTRSMVTFARKAPKLCPAVPLSLILGMALVRQSSVTVLLSDAT